MTLRRTRLEGLRAMAIAGLGILTGACLFEANAFADACSDATGKYDTALRAYASSKFQFPQDCARAQDYFRGRREQGQLLVSLFNAAKQACGAPLGEEHGQPPEHLVSLLEHEAVTLETGCNLVAGVQAPPAEPAPPPPPPPVAAAPTPPPPEAAAPATSAPPPAQTQAAAPPPSQAAAPPPQGQAPTPPSQLAPPPPTEAATAPNQTAPPATQTALQSCAVQKTMAVAPGCNADFPQIVTGAACTAADNSVGLTLQSPGREPTCCVTACARSK